MAVHQLVPTFVPGDATCMSAVQLQRLLRHLGHNGSIYAGEVHPTFQGWIQPVSALVVKPDDLVLYHHGIASWLSGHLLHLTCRKGVVFHNITPARYYQGTAMHEALVGGRAQLSAMAGGVDLALGVSKYNCGELRAAGYRNVHTVPLFVDADRFDLDRADVDLLGDLRSKVPTLLTVSRVLPHKRMEDVLSLFAELQRLEPEARLLVVGNVNAGSPSFRALRRRADDLGNVQFLDNLTHGELVAAYQSAHVFVSMSEHEGFGVPLIEAMASGLPVLAYGAAAVNETLDGAGISFDEKRFAFLAELARTLIDDGDLRDRIIQGQYARLRNLGPEVTERALAKALKSIDFERPAGTQRPVRRKKQRPHIGFLVQRYGEVTGGAEALAKLVAEQLAPHWDITVLTTTAKDHLTWANAFPEGEEQVGPVRVKRFGVARPREMTSFNTLSRTLFGNAQDRMREEHWVHEQGPVAPDLLEHLSTHAGDYDGFVAFTYLYAPVVFGLPMIADRTLLVPTAHDEAPLAFDIYRDVFERPAALLCNTPEEVQLIVQRFARHARTRVVGAGIDAPVGDGERFRQKFGLERPYLFYVGRIEAGKNVPWLIKLHQKQRRRVPSTPDLVLAGSGDLRPEGDGIHCIGRISEEDKWDGMAGAYAVAVPSEYESLSLLTLEAFSQGAPVLGNARSTVVSGQIQRSRAGFTFYDDASFGQALSRLGDKRLRRELARAGRAFAKRHSWKRVVELYLEEMNVILEKRP